MKAEYIIKAGNKGVSKGAKIRLLGVENTANIDRPK